jgi:hypothetical protein
MRSLVVALVLIVAIASAQQCAHSTTQTCTLAPYNIQLSQQIFCPRNDAVASRLQRNGTGCSDLTYCCQSLNDFSSAAASASVRVIGLFQSIDATSKALVVPAGQRAQLEFLRDACVGSISFTGVTSLNVTVYQFQDSGSISSSQVSLSAQSPLNLCHVAALTIVVPDSSDPDVTAASIQSINMCLLGADVDTCGVCNGNGVCQTAAPGGAAVLQSANVPPTINDRLSQQSVNSADAGIASVWASSTTTVRRAIIPTLVCNSRLASSDMCFAVFGYRFADYDPVLDNSTTTVYVPPSNNFFLPDPGYRGQPCVFTAPGNNASFGVLWDCTTHHNTKLSWTIISQSIDGQGPVDRSVVASRELNTCSDYYLSWL